MVDEILLYISAAPDLDREREVLGRSVADVPVTLGWRVVHSPARDDPVDLGAVAQADVHLVLLGSDIRAPVGLEWALARRAGRRPDLFLKQNVLRTAAAEEFVCHAGQFGAWQPFKDGAELRVYAFRLIAAHILDQANRFLLSPEEQARLQAWRADLAKAGARREQETRGGAGASAVVFSRERYVPSDGTLIEDREL
jgi:hypothetical protein